MNINTKDKERMTAFHVTVAEAYHEITELRWIPRSILASSLGHSHVDVEILNIRRRRCLCNLSLFMPSTCPTCHQPTIQYAGIRITRIGRTGIRRPAADVLYARCAILAIPSTVADAMTYTVAGPCHVYVNFEQPRP